MQCFCGSLDVAFPGISGPGAQEVKDQWTSLRLTSASYGNVTSVNYGVKAFEVHNGGAAGIAAQAFLEALP